MQIYCYANVYARRHLKLFHFQRDLVQPNGIYFKHLQTLSGGNCTDENANKHVKNCNALLNLIKSPLDNSETEIIALIDSKFKSKTWKANTCKIYLSSLIKFVKYLANSYRHLFDVQSLMSLATAMQKLRASLATIAKKEKKTRLKKSSVEENSGRLTPEDFKGYIDSQRRQDVAALFRGKPANTLTNHTSCRNYLLMLIAIRNPHRTGALMNMTLTEVYRAKTNIKNKCHVILTEKHKTVASFGPADVIVDEEVYRQLEVYRDELRPQSDSEEFFLSWTGKPIDSSIVINALSAELLRAGIEKK